MSRRNSCLLGQDAAEDVGDGQRVRRGRSISAEMREPPPSRRLPGPPARPAGRRPAAAQDLEEHALLHPGHLADALEPAVAHDRVRDGPDRRHDRVDEARLAARRLEVVGLRIGVDEVVDDRLGRADLLAPAVRRLADDLVRVLAVRQAHDADLVQLDAALGGGELADQALQRLDAERARLLAGGIDVVGERDLLGVAGQQRDLARASGPCRARRRRCRSRPGGPSARPCSPRRSRPGRTCASSSWPCRSRYSVRLLSKSGVAGVLRYLGPVSAAALRFLAFRPRIRPPMPTAAPFWSRIGNRTRPRNLSMTPTPRDARPARARRGRPRRAPRAGSARFSTSRRLIVSQPSGAQPSWARLDRRVGEAAAVEVLERRLAEPGGGQDLVVERDRGLQDVAEPRAMGVLALGPLVDLDAGLARRASGAPRETGPNPAA